MGKFPAPASVETGTAAQGIVPYWNKTLQPVLRPAPYAVSGRSAA